MGFNLFIAAVKILIF